VTNVESKVVQVEIPRARPASRITLLLDTFVLTVCRETPVAAAARLIGEHDTRSWRVVHQYVGEPWEKSDWSEVWRTRMPGPERGGDSRRQTSTHKGHRYDTLFVKNGAEKPARRLLAPC